MDINILSLLDYFYMNVLEKHPQWPMVMNICNRLKSEGFEAWLAGGCVRDGVLGVVPKDFDVATNGRPEIVEALFHKTVSVGKAFGVIRVVGDGYDVEVATFRHDKEYKDGRRPVGVVFCTPEEDALRRDFTVNALFYDPVLRKIHDFVKGLEDIQSRIIRTVGEPSERFKEDHLRLLRAARFVAQLGFEIEPNTYRAIEELHGLISTVSPERIRDEMTKLLMSNHAARGIEIAEKVGLLEDILPELKTIEQAEKEIGQTKRLLIQIHAQKLATPELTWLSFLHFLPDLEEILTRLKFSNRQSESIIQSVTFQRQLESSASWTRAQKLMFFAHPYARLSLVFFRLRQALIDERSKQTSQALFLEKEFQSFTGLPTPLVTADDLMLLGMKPGRELGELLKRTFEAQLNLVFGSKAGALDWVKKELNPPKTV